MDNSFELKALIDLLDDPDTEVYSAVSDKIVSQGLGVVPELERAFDFADNIVVQKRITDIIQDIQFKNVSSFFTNWLNSEEKELLHAISWIAKAMYPELDLNSIDGKIERLRIDTWLNLNDSLTAIEKTYILNHIFFSENKFQIASPTTACNHYINQLLISKKGSPILIALLYSVVAQKLNIPIFPVIIPKNFILAYQNINHPNPLDPKSVLFYVNTDNKGSVFGKPEIDNFLSTSKIKQENKYYLPCSNIDSIHVLLSSLIFHLEKEGKNSLAEKYKTLSDLIKQ